MYYVVSNLRVKVVGKGNVLHNHVAALPEIRIKIEEADGVNNRDVVVVWDFLSFALFFAFFGKVGYRHAQVEEASLDKMLLFLNLHLDNKPCAGGILALHVKHRPSASPCFAGQNCLYDFHVCDGGFEDFFEEGVEQEQEQVFALLVGKGFFEREIKRERGELALRRKLWFANKCLSGHNASYEKLLPFCWGNKCHIKKMVPPKQGFGGGARREYRKFEILKPVGARVFVVRPPIFRFDAVVVFRNLCCPGSAFWQAYPASLSFLNQPFNGTGFFFAIDGKHYPIAEVYNPAVRLGGSFHSLSQSQNFFFRQFRVRAINARSSPSLSIAFAVC
jgi:hypothetical protein